MYTKEQEMYLKQASLEAMLSGLDEDGYYGEWSEEELINELDLVNEYLKDLDYDTVWKDFK